VSYFHWITGCILGLIWFERLAEAAFGMGKIPDVSSPQWNRKLVTPNGNPRVSVIVPACNEADNIEQTLLQLLILDYDNYEIIAVDDRSTDRTGAIMDQIAATAEPKQRLKVIHVDELPSGWMGKTHAMWTASLQADGEWLLFTDADVLFKPDALRRALACAETEGADHLVMFPYMIMKRPGEKMMIAFFQMLFVFGHRPWKVADPDTKDHMGVGAFNLIRRPVYDAIGTYERLRMEVLDDMKLGKVVKNAGYAQRTAFGGDLISIRWARGAMGVVRNLTKNFFCAHVVPVAASASVLPGAGIPESDALHRSCIGAWPGPTALCGGDARNVLDLCGHVAEVSDSPVLFPSPSHQHGSVCLYHAAFDAFDPRTRGSSLAGNVLSAGRVEEGNGVAWG